MLVDSKTPSRFMSFFDAPRLVFIESSCPAFLSKYSDGQIFVYTKEAYKYSLPGQKTIVVSTFLMRYLKVFCALLRFSCTFQGGAGIAYRLSKSKSVISDGILTEWLFRKGHIKPHTFISIADIKPALPVMENQQLILGNNWYEFGIFSRQRYEHFLRILKNHYPDAYYYPHPKEGRDLLKEVFGPRLIESSDNIETYCVKNGIPDSLIGYLGSTAMASLGQLAKSSLTIVAIDFDASDCDGPLGDVTDPHLLRTAGIKVTLRALEETVQEMLKDIPTVSIKKYHISFANK